MPQHEFVQVVRQEPVEKWGKEYTKTYNAEYYKNNLDKIKAKKIANKEATKIYNQEYWRQNGQAIYDRHKEKIRIANKKWRVQNKDKCALYRKQRRALKMGAEGFHTLEEWNEIKRLHEYRCLFCGRHESELQNDFCKILTEDHIVPLSLGGSDYIENIRPLCQSCNSKRNASMERGRYN